MSTTQLRRARKSHWCGSCGRSPIRPGDHYLMHTDFPGSDVGCADAAGHPVRLAECRSCAERYGRGALFPTSSAPVSSTPGVEDAPSASRDGTPAAEGAYHFPS
jgi:hypothetical protein